MADASAHSEIKLNVDYTGRHQIKQAIRDQKDLRREVNKTSRAFASSSAGGGGGPVALIEKMGKKDKVFFRLTKQVTEFDKMASMMAKGGLKALSLGMKAATIQMAAMGAAMLAVHAAFVLGNGVMKVMRSLQGPLAAGMAAVVAGAAAFSAAMREQQAAMYAYKTTNKKEFGSSLNQTRQVMRALHTDTYLATAGEIGRAHV